MGVSQGKFDFCVCVQFLKYKRIKHPSFQGIQREQDLNEDPHTPPSSHARSGLLQPSLRILPTPPTCRPSSSDKYFSPYYTTNQHTGTTMGLGNATSQRAAGGRKDLADCHFFRVNVPNLDGTMYMKEILFAFVFCCCFKNTLNDFRM